MSDAERSAEMTERDRADAALILAVLRATSAWEQSTGHRAVVKPVRETIWFIWERPRLPKPLHKGKYPLSVPWTPAAREALSSGGKLTIEHVLPAAVLVRRLLDDPPVSEAALQEVLSELCYVVVADDDEQRLRASGVSRSVPEGASSPWDRYRVAGIDLNGLRPLARP